MAMCKDRIERPYTMSSKPTLEITGAKFPRFFAIPTIPTEVVVSGIKICAYLTL
jgi:hypothetical protein